MDKIEVNILFTAEDIQKSYELHLKKIQPFRSRILLILGILLILMGVLLVFLQNLTEHITWASWAFILYGLFVLLYYYWKYKRMGLTAFRKLVEFQHSFKYTITPDSICMIGKNSSSDSNWEHYEFAIITSNIILLYVNKLRFTMLPSKYFTDEEFKTLIEWVKDKVKCK